MCKYLKVRYHSEVKNKFCVNLRLKKMTLYTQLFMSCGCQSSKLPSIIKVTPIRTWSKNFNIYHSKFEKADYKFHAPLSFALNQAILSILKRIKHQDLFR